VKLVKARGFKYIGLVYHLMTERRRSLSGLNGLRLNGQWCEDPPIIKEMVKKFFRDKRISKEEIKEAMGNFVLISYSG